MDLKRGTETTKGYTVLTSWLSGKKIPHRFEDGKLLVTLKGGGELPVEIVDFPRSDGITYFILTQDILNPNHEVGFLTFSNLVVRCGYEGGAPVDRGATPAKKSSYKEDFDAVAMRHSEFRAAPNPDETSWKWMRPVITKAVNAFMNKNRAICDKYGFDEGDLAQYANVWAVNFLHKYRILNADKFENEKLLMHYLKQRFYELFKLLSKKNRSVNPTVETLHISLYDNAGVSPIVSAHPDLEGSHFHSEQTDVVLTPFFHDPHALVDEEPERTGLIDCRTEGRRRSSATRLLKKMLGELPKETRVYKLIEVANSPHFCEDAKRMAVKYLKLEGVDFGSLDVDEYFRTVDRGGN